MKTNPTLQSNNTELSMEHITMSKKECEQIIVFEKIKGGEITRLEGALQLGLSERWVRKKIKRYLADGAGGVTHRSRNRISPKRWCVEEKAFAIELLRNDWRGFGPTFTAEKLRAYPKIE